MELHVESDSFSLALERARHEDRSVALVPTMGALHAGHRSLIERARDECAVVAVSIFVNPLQFSDQADLETYPRDKEGDLALCEDAGADVVFVPGVGALYPDWPAPQSTIVTVGPLGAILEGKARPGHFDGVATVVAKLFSLAGRCHAYFGEKDFQQLAIVRRMASDLRMPVEVIGAPTVRESDGLALSSRNVRLSEEGRRRAAILSASLAAGASLYKSGVRDTSTLEAVMTSTFTVEPSVIVDYAVAVDEATLSKPPGGEVTDAVRFLVAAHVEGVRLIDNCGPDGLFPARGEW